MAPPAPIKSLPIDAIVPSPTNRKIFNEESLRELADSIRIHGLFQAIVVRPLDPDRYEIVAGERRWRASALAGLSTINATIHVLSDSQAREAQLVENIQHEDLHPLDEADAYAALLKLDPAYTPESVALRVGKTKRHVYQRLTYVRLVSEVRDAFRSGIITPAHADRLAQVPAAQQPEGLRRCFFPVLGATNGDAADPLALAPLRHLDDWINDAVRLDVRSEDTRVFLPTLAEQVADVEAKAGATALALSTHTFHVKTDVNTEPQPILAQSWRNAEGRNRCKHAQLGVIVLGPGRGSSLHVCVAKRVCPKHWPQAKSATRPQRDHAAEAASEQKRRDEAARRERARVWRSDHYVPGVIKALAARTKARKLTLDLLLRHIDVDADVLALYLGPLDRLTPTRFGQLCIVALALDRCLDWQDNKLTELAKEFGVDTRKLRKALLKATPPDSIMIPSVTAA